MPQTMDSNGNVKSTAGAIDTVPVGSIVIAPSTATGYIQTTQLPQQLVQTSYPDLYTAIGNTYGNNPTAGSFYLPGWFLFYWNYLINGGFDFAQRQTPGTFTTPTQTSGSAADTTHDGYSADRWKCSFQTATLKYKRVDTAGALETGLVARYYGQYQQQTNAGKFAVYQIIESLNSFPLNGNSLSLQIKLKASGNKTIKIGVFQLTSSGTADTIPNPILSAWNSNTVDPTWGTNISLVGSAVSCAVTTSWQQFSVPVVTPTDAKNLIVVVWTDSQFSTNDTLSMSEASLTIAGANSVGWMPRPIATELAMCRRFYWKTYNVDTPPANATSLGSIYVISVNSSDFYQEAMQYPTMRSAPTIALYSPSTGSSGNWFDNTASADHAVSASGVGDSCFRLQPGAGAVNAVHSSNGHITADAEL